MTPRFIGLLLAMTLVVSDAAAQGYRWVDEQGQVHYAGSRDQVPEPYRSQLPPGPPAPAQSTPDVSSRPATPVAGECILLVPGSMRRPRGSRSYPNCGDCQKAIEVLSADEAARASCVPFGQ